ncbi:MAG TPA: alpha/beta hydrolase [Pyrinomonadaceae bacterium]
MKIFRRVFSVATAAALLCLSQSADAGQQAAGASTPTAPGRMVDVGGYRLHLNCVGRSGGPVVVLLAGGGDFSFDWSLVQPAVSRFARVCSYDRAGLAWSDLGPVPRTMRQEAHELRALLERAGVRGPYVLVGHSFGGLIARVFAERYASDVAGVVLVDATSEDTTLMFGGKLVRVREGAKGKAVPPPRTLQDSPPLPPADADLKQAELNRQVFGPPKINPPFDKLPKQAQALRLWALSNPKLSAASEDFWADELQAMYVATGKTKHQLGDMPLVVVIPHTKGDDRPPDGVSAADWARLRSEKRQQKLAFADLSRGGKVVFAEGSGHHVQLDAPEVVVGAIRETVAAARRRTRPGRRK